MKKTIHSQNAPSAIGPYSQAVWAGDILYSSGQIAMIPESGDMDNDTITIETHRVMKNIHAILQEAGLDFQNIIKSSIFIKNMNDFSEINSVYSSYLQEPYPARETVEVARLPKDANIEISFIARK